MNRPNDAKEVALFRFQTIAPLLTLSGPRGTLKREIQRIAERTHHHLFRGPIRVGFGTIEEWLHLYKREGFDGLLPLSREDRGKSRAIEEDLAEKIELLARTRSDLDGRGILAELKPGMRDGKRIPSLSTLYRFLRARGLDQRRAPPRQDHRAFAFDLAGDCYVMYGPAIPQPDGTRRKTYPIAILDDATRIIAHAQFYFAEHLRSLKDCLKQALLKRGLPRRLYFDNGKIFRSRMILQLCARLTSRKRFTGRTERSPGRLEALVQGGGSEGRQSGKDSWSRLAEVGGGRVSSHASDLPARRFRAIVPY